MKKTRKKKKKKKKRTRTYLVSRSNFGSRAERSCTEKKKKKEHCNIHTTYCVPLLRKFLSLSRDDLLTCVGSHCICEIILDPDLECHLLAFYRLLVVFYLLPCHVTICIQKNGHRPGWICRYFRGSRRAGKFKPGISRPGGKYRKLTTAAAAAAVTAAVICGKYRRLTTAAAAAAVTAAVIWAIRGAWENNFPTFTVGVYRRDPGQGLRPRPGPCGTPRQWM